MKKIILGALLFTIGCTNANTPAGHEGYVKQMAVFGKTSFYSTQVGPTSTGVGWMLDVVNVDFRWETYTEEFEVMSSDNLLLKFSAHLIMRPTAGSVRRVVEEFGGPDWYARSLRQPLRNAVQEAVAGYKALDAKDRREQIGASVQQKFLAYLTGKPFETQSLVIGNIQFPASVATAQEQRIAKETELSRKEFEVEIAKKDATVRIEEAKGIAESQRIIQATLTPSYLQHEAIKAQEKMAGSPNYKVIYIPSGVNGIPLVQNVEKAEKD